MISPDPHRRRARLTALAAAGFLLFMAGQGLWFLSAKSVTFDEANHLAAGFSALRTGDFKLYPVNPPLIRSWNSLPWLAMEAPLPLRQGWEQGRAIIMINEIAAASAGRFHHLVMAARVKTLLLAIMLGLVLFHDVNKRYGRFAGIIALALYCSQPMLIAHGSLATVDLGPALFLYLAVRGFVIHQERGWTWARTLLMGLYLGAALAAKFSNLSLLFILPVLGLVIRPPKEKTENRRAKDHLRALGKISAALLTALFLLNLTYGFQGTFHRLDSHQFESGLMKGAARALPGALPVPLPFHLVRGFDLQSFDNQTMGGKNALNYWRGEWTPGRLPFYHLWLLATKPTLPLIALCLAAVAAGVYRRLKKKGGLDWFSAACLLAALLQYLVMAHLVAMYFGVRYLLGLFPFLVVLAALGAKTLAEIMPVKWRPRETILALVVGSALFTAFSTAPDQLCYNNLLMGSKERQDRLDPDACRDWGQDLIGLKKWMEKTGTSQIYLGYFGAIDPAHYGVNWLIPPPEPAPGTWAVSRSWINSPHPFQFARGDSFSIIPQPIPYFGWLAGHKPVARIGCSINIYQIE